MDWHNLVLKNIWRNMRRYLGYLLSSSMAITIFSMFFIFIFNPKANAVASLQIVQVVLLICVCIVAMFAVFFIFYFHSSLIRVRNKEFGLLMTLGMTPRQIGHLIFYESICISLASMLIGLVLGILCSQPFLIATKAMLGLQDAIPFELSVWSVGITAIFFGSVFVCEALIISWRVAHRTPRILILGARTRQNPPRSSLPLVILGLLCLLVAYAMALLSGVLIVLTAIPVVTLTIIGTFLLFSQVLGMFLAFLRRRSLHGLTLLIVARLAHRIKDYSRLLAMIVILNAMVLTGMGAVLSFLQAFQVDALQTHPLDIQITETLAQPFSLSLKQIQDRLSGNHLTIQNQLVVPLLTGQVNSVPVSVLSSTNFETMRTTILAAHPALSSYTPASIPPAALYVPQDPLARAPLSFALPADHQIQLQIGSTSQTLRVDEGHTRVLNMVGGAPQITLVVNDQIYAHLQQGAALANQLRVYAFYFPNQQQTLTAASTLKQVLGAEQERSLAGTTSSIFVLQIITTLLFAGCFVSALFLFAAGSALYFKLFTQQDEDRTQFRAVNRVGLQQREAKHILSIEFLLLFFLPVLIAMLHSGVATMTLILLVSNSANAFSAIAQIIWSAWGITCLIYAACFAVYFLVARANYFRRVRIAIA